MREWTIPAEGEGKRLDRYVASNMPALKIPLLQKYLRLGRIKRNGKRAKGDERLIAGDVLALYLNDELFDAVPEKKPDPLLSKFRHNVTVLYEDESILLADKRPGLIVHPDEEEKVNTLVTHVRAYLYQKGEYDPKGGFSPAPCNRIDRFTGGIVIFAKTQEALLQMDNLIRERKLRKLYLCIVKGRMQPEEGSLENYLLKDGKTLELKEAVIYDGYYAGAYDEVDNEINPWFYSTTGFDESDYNPISEEKAREIMDSYEYIDIDFTPFEE